MNRVFGKKKAKAPPPSLDKAAAGLGDRVNTMDQKINSLENELRGYKEKMKKAKSPAAKKQLQKRAMEVLKRKRMYEQQRDTVAGQQFNIDQASFGIESAKANIETVAAMKAANTELKRTMKKDLNIDEVEDIADGKKETDETMRSLTRKTIDIFRRFSCTCSQTWQSSWTTLMKSMKHWEEILLHQITLTKPI
mmetsp:Transcript_23103/g.56980  ORF Transcript_23103/g.56980 Transcript_23103/m.56980 type:complete len:194 (-) Transcript_23103:287-868(-)